MDHAALLPLPDTDARRRPAGPPGAGLALRVTDAHLSAALDELLDTGNQLTRVLLGAPGRALLGTDAVIPEQGQRPRP